MRVIPQTTVVVELQGDEINELAFALTDRQLKLEVEYEKAEDRGDKAACNLLQPSMSTVRRMRSAYMTAVDQQEEVRA